MRDLPAAGPDLDEMTRSDSAQALSQVHQLQKSAWRQWGYQGMRLSATTSIMYSGRSFACSKILPM
jgi:hypothetical protein